MNLYVSNCIKFIVLQFVKNVSDHPENYGRNINVRMSFVKFYQFMINKKNFNMQLSHFSIRSL